MRRQTRGLPAAVLMGSRSWVVAALVASSMVVAAHFPTSAAAPQTPPAAAPVTQKPAQVGCRVTGRVTSVVAAFRPFAALGLGRAGQSPDAPVAQPPATVTLPLPGATIVVHQGTRLVVATSADATGRFSILFTPGQTFHVSAEMTAFRTQERDLTLGALPCDTTLDFALELMPRTETLASTLPVPSPAGQAAAEPSAAPRPGTTTPSKPDARAGTPGQPAAAQPGRFTPLNVNADATGAAAIENAASPPDQSAEIARLLPPGFTLQGASADAVSVNAGADAMNVDRGTLNDRMSAIGRGEFDPTTGQFAQGFGPAGGDGAFGQGFGGLNADGGRGRGGQGGFPGGGPGGDFALGGRGGRGQSPYRGTANYGYGGSALDATNFQPRNGIVTPVSAQPFARNNFGVTFGGPLTIPGIYKNTNRRTNFQVNYAGNHSTNLQDQYATVPTNAMRNGDFSGSAIQLINPRTGLPFPNNQIPVAQMDPAALALLTYIPPPNVDGVTTQNFHTAATVLSTSNSVNVRINQNLTPTLPQRGGGAGGRGAGGGGGGRGGQGGQGGQGGRGLTINLSAQVQYRGNESQQFNVLPQLGGTSKGTSLTVPINLTVAKGRTVNMFAVNVARTKNTTSNAFSNAVDVGALAGINYPSQQDPLNWGVPNLTFSNFNVRSNAANSRSEHRMTLSYTLTRPMNRHLLRMGVDFRRDASSSQSNANARGAFTFTGLYTSNGALIARDTGADIADFLLGMPQQATLQVGGVTQLRQKTFSAYLEDNWQKSSRLTFNLGVRWELPMPYVEAGGRMANLDVTPTFTAASLVLPGATGAQSGTEFAAGLMRTDWNNIGPRVGMAYRIARGTVLNTSYSITYNASTYSSIARQLVGQPPFAETETNPGSLASPISLESGLLGGSATTTNNFGVDPRYGLGMIQTWNSTLSRTFRRVWSVTAGYTGARGTSLDLLRAPNRNSDGTLRIAGVQPFIWESSGGHSLLSLGSVSIQRGMANGLRFGASYTLARSMDNASSLGAGGAVVAQNDQDLEAEYALSNFDQRHQFTANMTWELPFGVGKKWLANGGRLAAIAGEWSMNLNVSANSGSPFTPRVVGATTSVASGTSGSLRANYLGGPISTADPTLLDFFNTGAFAAPAFGAFGTSPRNVIIGPGGYVVNAQFSRDMRIGSARSVGIQINVNNLFNTTRWSAIDTNVNSNTFGQVTRFAQMRTITLGARFRF